MTSRRQDGSRAVVIALAVAACAACAARAPARAAATAAAPCAVPPDSAPDSLTLTGADGPYALTLVAARLGSRRDATGTLTVRGTDRPWFYPPARHAPPGLAPGKRLGIRLFDGAAALPLAALGVEWPAVWSAGVGPDSLIVDGHEFHCEPQAPCIPGGGGMPTLGLLLRPPPRPGDPQVARPSTHGDGRWPRLVPTRRDAAGFAGRWTSVPQHVRRSEDIASGYFCAVRRSADGDRPGAAR